MEKETALETWLKTQKKLAIAFSAGVDSTFLLYKAVAHMGCEQVVAVTIHSMLHQKAEIEEAKKICEALHVTHLMVYINEYENPSILKNTKERCYRCKKYLFERVLLAAKEQGCDNVADGTNYDDIFEYRPGLAALKELGILSPLKELGWTKDEIRACAKKMGLATFSKPSSPCLATRIPYDVEITKEKLEQVQQGEALLKDHGFGVCRLRHYGNTAKIEVLQEENGRLAQNKVLIEQIKKLGFLYVTLDLEGFSSGSMDKVLKKETRD